MGVNYCLLDFKRLRIHSQKKNLKRTFDNQKSLRWINLNIRDSFFLTNMKAQQLTFKVIFYLDAEKRTNSMSQPSNYSYKHTLSDLIWLK